MSQERTALDVSALFASYRGVIVTFDFAEGLGTCRRDDGVIYGFHCTALTDGSRDIAVGAAVSFLLRPGRLGVFEATEITPL